MEQRDRPEPEIEITPEMKAAGIDVARLYNSEDSLADMVTSVFRAMSRCARPSPQKEPR